ncbi:uncharacterized protein LOC130897815 [Diorhabda carinulata]|uniref:uncharacterized protein LOC130897815 n=1 Tax=Diorhabda carinulata TaxID=1163345 RepID=UPI0025A12F14|nr:uncharacterized protein LOC130897815 [Diorhabda carinulata]
MRQKRGKKRPCNPDNWVMKKTKTLRNSGLGYVSYKSKRSVSARKIRPSCGSKCRLKCSEKIKEEVRQQLFSGFWSLGDVQRQREFIVSYSDEIKPKYRYSSTQNFRAMNRAFYFDVHNVRMRVCKQFFMATLDINARTIQTAFSKKSSTGFVAEDRRGKHNNHPTVDPEIKESVPQFINSIPRNEGDNVHSVIEKQISRHLRASPIYIPDQYVTLIQSAKKTGLPYKVHVLNHETFYDLKVFAESFGSNFNVNTERSTVTWHDIKIIRVEKQHANSFFYKTSYENEEFKEIDVRGNKRSRPRKSMPSQISSQLVLAYSKKIPLAENKKKDIKDLIQKRIIPQYY